MFELVKACTEESWIFTEDARIALVIGTEERKRSKMQKYTASHLLAAMFSPHLVYVDVGKILNKHGLALDAVRQFISRKNKALEEVGENLVEADQSFKDVVAEAYNIARKTQKFSQCSLFSECPFINTYHLLAAICMVKCEAQKLLTKVTGKNFSLLQEEINKKF